MPYDLVIKNGTVIDGSGLPRYRADVAVRHGRVAAIGRIREAAREVIDAAGQMVTTGITYGGYVGHSARRTCAMGERAFEKEASEDDLRAMERELRDGIRAGAIGFTTSRSPSHETPDRRPVASRLASWDEVRRLVGVMGEMNAGIFELAGERAGGDPERLREYHLRLRDLALQSGRPITWGLFSRREEPDLWRTYLALLEETAAPGGRMVGQGHRPALTVAFAVQGSP